MASLTTIFTDDIIINIIVFSSLIISLTHNFSSFPFALFTLLFHISSFFSPFTVRIFPRIFYLYIYIFDNKKMSDENKTRKRGKGEWYQLMHFLNETAQFQEYCIKPLNCSYKGKFDDLIPYYLPAPLQLQFYF